MAWQPVMGRPQSQQSIGILITSLILCCLFELAKVPGLYMEDIPYQLVHGCRWARKQVPEFLLL